MIENNVVIEVGEIIGIPHKKCVWIGNNGSWVNLTEDGVSEVSAKEMAIQMGQVIQKFMAGKVQINLG